jgi:PKD repeat protein
MRAAVALASIVAVSSLGCSDSDLGLGPSIADPSGSRAAAPPGQSIREAIRAQERHTPAMMRIKGVVGTGVGLDDDGAAVVRIFTTEPGIRGIPEELDDVPTDIKTTGLLMAGANTTARARPAPTGYSVGHRDITAGTIGGVVVKGSGETFILSNNHVLANSNDASIGDPILQPGPFDGGTDPSDQIGMLADFEPIDFSSGAVNLMDAAIAEVSASDVDPSTPSDGFGVINSQQFVLDGDGDGFVDSGVLGLSVQKYGRTTLLTTGQVTEINVTANVCYEAILGIFCIKSANFEDLLGFPAISDGGDSGSSIVTTDGTNRAVALLFAGSATSTLASRMDLVLQRFGVTFEDGSGGPGNQPPVASFTFTCTDLDCSFDGSGSTDDGTITGYNWDFGDGETGTGANVGHTYGAGGTYDVTLTVTDDGGLSGSDTRPVTVTAPGGNQPPVASFTFTCVDLDCSFDGSGSTDDGTITLYSWEFGDGDTGTGASVGHTYGSGGTYDVTLTVTDDGGLSDSDTRPVTATDPPTGEPTLTGSGRKVKGRHVIDLAWSNVPWPQIYVFRGEAGNTVLVDILPAAQTGTYSDVTGNKGKALYTHFLCEGTGLFDECTNPLFTSF